MLLDLGTSGHLGHGGVHSGAVGPHNGVRVRFRVRFRVRVQFSSRVRVRPRDGATDHVAKPISH